MFIEGKHLCNVCLDPILVENSQRYIECKQCNSYTIISESNSITDNQQYFDKQYENYQNLKSPFRSFIYKVFSRINSLINQVSSIDLTYIFIQAKMACEIGFGNGSHLSTRLNQGVNIIGVELSNSAVKNFKNTFPEYEDSVFNDSLPPENCDLVYSDALLEHIEDPNDFLKNISQKQPVGSKCIMRFPYLPKHITFCNESNDINFWFPCHRTLLSNKGINKLFENCGYLIEEKYDSNTYAYRVLNLMLKKGYPNVHLHRNTNFTSKDHPNLVSFLVILFMSLFSKNRSIETIVIASKA